MTGTGAKAPRPPRAGATTAAAIVLRRSDFRESSRVVTLLTREHGRLSGLAKGAHRADSPFLGRLDFLNEVRATLSADRGGLRLLLRVELLRERRGLRAPARFLAASHLVALCEPLLPEGRPEPAAFDLLHGGLALIERCPEPALPQVLLGLELRHLDLNGALPDLARCGECGAALDDGAFRGGAHGLSCRRHALLPRRVVPAAAVALLRTLHAAKGREWPALARPDGLAAAAALPAAWLAAATEHRSPWRRALFARLEAAPAGARRER